MANKQEEENVSETSGAQFKKDEKTNFEEMKREKTKVELTRDVAEASEGKPDLDDIKREKAKAKSQLTRAKHHLLNLLDQDLPSRRELRTARQKLIDLQEPVMNLLSLSAEYKKKRVQDYLDARRSEASSINTGSLRGSSNLLNEEEIQARKRADTIREEVQKVEEAKRILEEEFKAKREQLEQLNETIQEGYKELEQAENEVQRMQEEESVGYHDTDNPETDSIINVVSVAVISGDKRTYESWKAALDKAPATPEYKLLQLRQYLSGEALKAVEHLGHSAFSYEAAKDRLDRKFGGQRRQVMRHLEQLDLFRPIRAGNSNDVEKFADILDVAVVNLKKAGRTDELKNGSLYVKLQKNIPETMLSTYHRWVFEKQKTESVEILREWIIQESEFRTVANETVYGLHVDSNNNLDGKKCVSNRIHRRAFFGNTKNLPKSANRYQHVQSASVLNRNAPEFCPPKDTQRQNPSVNSVVNNNVDTQRLVNQDRTLTCHGGEPQFIALRTISVIVRNGSKTVRINALLDDASTRTYINSDVAAELGLHGKLQRVTVGVLNNKTESFETMPVEFQIESIDGKIKTKVEALTADKVTGDMCVVNWKEYQHKWNHLKGLKFPVIGKHPLVDILIGMDNSELHYAYREIRVRPNEPVARLTPLGWTCVGKIYGGSEICVQTHYNRTYFLHNQRSENETDKILCKFWEMEGFSEPKKQLFSPEEQIVYSKVKESLKFVEGRYEVAIPWKKDAWILLNYYDMALQRLENTEKRLMRNKEVRDSYSNTIERYVEKGNIHKIDHNEEKSGTWYLPHFPVIRPDKTTTKTRIVFDASAKHDGVSLNDMIHCGPQLQNELFNVLLRFRRNSVALVCDIAEMYLRIKVPLEDRPYQRFLWHDMMLDARPDVYEFSSVVFGINSSPFQVQLVAQTHAEINRENYPMAAETVLKSTYMDDSMDSVSSEEDGIKLYS
ncbi:uncharacterized protein LOC133198039 [Saccostrea echinata]|uniref:uncharacterized protein LOC133198039 n=1 Tax=Saccostrea echinata TaxID=191078 RepID=UPI002A7F7A39|nr:uncharacterized protein LOC133198039 [Saccostrea echinata]